MGKIYLCSPFKMNLAKVMSPPRISEKVSKGNEMRGEVGGGTPRSRGSRRLGGSGMGGGEGGRAGFAPAGASPSRIVGGGT